MSTNKRPTCPSCTRPTKLCLCTRFKNPILDNTISVTVLQHSLEKKHPLNSARIATLGLKNISLVHVSDVLNEAQFQIQCIQSNADVGQNGSVQKCEKIESLHVFESNGDLGRNDSVENGEKIGSFDMGLNDLSEKCEKIESLSFCDSNLDVGLNGLVENGEKMESLKPMDISFTIDKKGVIIKNYGFDKLLVDQCAIRNGFNVKKIRKANDGKCVKEFEINVGPGSLLLFPSEGSVGVEDIGFDVKNLIVLDGTWGKATRMYKENPWLKLLPHLKLDIDKMSLYAEVRRQPKAGYLSSIESIVYAMKAIGGEDVEKLDCLLDVFESMVVDQRRCKDEALNLVESNITSM
uniref:tRNA-uridine aminocarboxypropyltransferase n=1 Tax=Tanacetum cinerariifolium TaxID=118510 RepID=A0A6L2MYP4_TANCI|nr:DTW domain-containing protein [Tanacetum cinerariifolium]